MIGDLVYETASTGFAEPEIEEARQAAWDAISALAKTLKEEGFAAPAMFGRRRSRALARSTTFQSSVL
jgi:hypothetical protein